MADTRVAIKIEADSAGLSRGLRTAQSDLQRFASSSSASLGGLKNALAGIAATIGAGLGIRELVGTLAEFDKLNASLKTVTGSMEAAARAGEQLRAFASSTPYELNDVTEAFIRLKSVGLDSSIEALRSFGNTAAAMGKPMMQFIEAVADAATGQFERLKEFGIKAQKEGQNITFVFQGVSTTVRNTSEEITRYLTNLGNTKFATGMSDQMNTIGGAISNLKDAFASLVDFVGNLGIRQALMRSFAGVTEFLNAFRQQLSAVFGQGLQSQVDAFSTRQRELKGKLENFRSLLKVPIVGRLVDTNQIAQTEKDLQGVTNALADLQRQQAEASKVPEITLPKLSGGGGGQIGGSGRGGGGGGSALRGHQDAMKKIKQDANEIKSVFEEWEDRGGRFADVINPAMEQAKDSAIEITSVWEELAKKDLDEVLHPPSMEADIKANSNAAREFSLVMTSSISSAITNWQGFGNLLKSIGLDIAQLIIKFTILKPLMSAFEGLFSGAGEGIMSGIGSFFGFAEGGIMTPHGPLPLKSYAAGGVARYPQLALFGEGRLNEAFVPLPDGKRIPVAMSGAAGGNTIQQTFNISGGIDAAMERRLAQAAEEGARRGYQLVHDDAVRNGPIRKQLR